MKNITRRILTTCGVILLILLVAFGMEAIMKKSKKEKEYPWISLKINATGDSTIETNERGERIARPIKDSAKSRDLNDSIH